MVTTTLALFAGSAGRAECFSGIALQRQAFRSFFLLALVLALAAGCASRQEKLDSLADKQGWIKVTYPTREFVLTGMMPGGRNSGEVLTVYVEGDGRAWITPTQISSDPTPSDPVALELALRHPFRPVLYLARPCQYGAGGQARGCHPAYWTSHRYAPEVINSMSAAIDAAKQSTGARKVIVVGYSGGGAVAALLGAARTDVAGLITLSGNLDHRRWTESEGLTPLFGSLNPADKIDVLQRVEQIHFVGADDDVVPPASVLSYRDRFPPGRKPDVRVIRNFDHSCCWVDSWPGLMKGRWPEAAVGR